MCMLLVIAANEFSDMKWTTRQSVCNGLILHLQRPSCWMIRLRRGKKERRGRKKKEKEGKNTDLAETSNTSTRSTQHKKTGRPLSGGVWWRGVLQSREMEAAYHLFSFFKKKIYHKIISSRPQAGTVSLPYSETGRATRGVFSSYFCTHGVDINLIKAYSKMLILLGVLVGAAQTQGACLAPA